MFEYDIDVAFAGDVPDSIAETPGLFRPGRKLRRIHRRHLAPAVELLAVDHTLGAKIEDILGSRLIGDHRNGVCTGRRHELHSEYAETTRTAPHQDIVTWLESVRRVAEEHAVRRRKRERVAR